MSTTPPYAVRVRTPSGWQDLALTGPQGPKGDPGDAGAGQSYRHVQTTAATVWSITHDLPFRPNVTAVDSTGREMWPGALDYSSATLITLTFSAAVGGEAYLS